MAVASARRWGGDDCTVRASRRRRKYVTVSHPSGNVACMKRCMNALAQTLAPNATDLIRTDHTKVLSAFHRYKMTTGTARKQALVNTVCLALEVHAQMEEEIFYP